MRVLFIVASPEYLRFYDTTIQLLAKRGHEVMVAVNKDRDGKPVRLGDLGSNSGITLLGVVPQRGDHWTSMARLVRGLMDYVRYLHPRFAHAPALRQRLARKGLPPLLRLMDARIGVRSDRFVRVALRFLSTLERGIPTSRLIERFLMTHRPDLVVVSPLVDVASDQVDIVRAGRRLGVRVVAAIASWDNLTNKGLLRVEPDAILVWNEAQKLEATELHGVSPERVVVTGAQLFDHWFHKTPTRSLAAFAERVGLASVERFVLFTGSSMFISAPEAEVAFVKRWLVEMRQSQDARLSSVPIVIRPHPYNGWVWADVDVSEYGPVAVWPRGKYNPVDPVNRDDYFDSLYYCQAVVGINTSAMVEASILGRSVHSIVTEDFAKTQEGTLHFHHLLPENGGFLQVGHGLTHHASLLSESLSNEAAAQVATRLFVGRFLRPYGIERDCTPIVSDALERLAVAQIRPPEQAALPRVLSVALFPLAQVLTHVPSRGRQARRMRKEVGRALEKGRKRTSKAFRVASKKARQVRKSIAVRVRNLGA